MKKIKEWKGIYQIMAFPLFWVIAILKILIALPMLIISECNKIILGQE